MVTTVPPLASSAIHQHLHAVDVEERQDGQRHLAATSNGGRLHCSMLATRLRWVSITPFGSPVVPEE